MKLLVKFGRRPDHEPRVIDGDIWREYEPLRGSKFKRTILIRAVGFGLKRDRCELIREMPPEYERGLEAKRARIRELTAEIDAITAEAWRRADPYVFPKREP